MATLVVDFLVRFRTVTEDVARLCSLLAEVGDLTLEAADARGEVLEVRMVGKVGLEPQLYAFGSARHRPQA